ncbi:hypothetical protein FPQ18DRAFT_135314 [Pyronema domesticum]|uniref:Similar to Meiotically up-regulated gene 163 protein acc. no. O94410 n=1 Tax=Pyronema omphalodes (strain CBS 100304) TaxID=1076935 RepID=U4LAK3_PYROM|nr:hypothetical protein FPQ18DRAFT_135314 [Pyronema domesticum]CCX07189.1 Similar to Meiotically up-regulated gene 163 protein; acc. no. O94410 [Pyronema omphalodes CBS 100304]
MLRSRRPPIPRPLSRPSHRAPLRLYTTPVRREANSTRNALPATYFHPNTPRRLKSTDNSQPPDERTLALGKTIRILQERMPTLLQSPLPTEILSPSIRLHLFPRTHPMLPAVSGRVAYIAALWTAPIAWGKLPGGSTRLEVVSERMMVGEKLRVRWKAVEEQGNKEFAGIFEFEFDEKGRIKKHVIENMEDDEGEVAGVITVTEWLIRKAKGVQTQGEGQLAWHCSRVDRNRGRRDQEE